MTGPYSQPPKDVKLEALLTDLHRRVRMMETRSLLRGDLQFTQIQIGGWIIEERAATSGSTALYAYPVGHPSEAVPVLGGLTLSEASGR